MGILEVLFDRSAHMLPLGCTMLKADIRWCPVPR